MLYIHGSLLILQQLVACEEEGLFIFLSGQNIHELFDVILRCSNNWALSSKASHHDRNPNFGFDVPNYASIVFSALGTLSNYLSTSINRRSVTGSPSSVVENSRIYDHGVSLSLLMILSLSKTLEPTVRCFSLTLLASCIRHGICDQSKVTYFRDVCAQLSESMQSPRSRFAYFLVDVFLSIYEVKDFVAIGGGTNRQSKLNIPLKELLEWILHSQNMPVEISNRAIRSIGIMVTSMNKKLMAMASDVTSIKLILFAVQGVVPSPIHHYIACVALWAVFQANDKTVAIAKSFGLDGAISPIPASIHASHQQSFLSAWLVTYERAIFGIHRCLD